MLDRRRFLAVCSQFGLASTLLPGALYTIATQAQTEASATSSAAPSLPTITSEMVEQAAALAGVPIAPDQISLMLNALNQQRDGYSAIRALHIQNSVAPAYIFDPLPQDATVQTRRESPKYGNPPTVGEPPINLEELAFANIPKLAEYMRTRKSFFRRTHGNVYRAHSPLQSRIALPHHAHRRTRHGAGQSRRCRNCLGKISRPPAWLALGCERSARRERLSHHLGRRRIRASNDSTRTPPSSSGWMQPAPSWWRN